MIYLMPFDMSHFDSIMPRLRSFDAISLQGIDPDHYRDVVETFSQDSPVATFMSDEGVAAVGGAIKQWEGVAQWWMLTSPLVDRYKLTFQKSCIEGIKFLNESFGLHRLEASIAETHIRSQKWAESLGFKNEGMMTAYGPDMANHYRYARIWL